MPTNYTVSPISQATQTWDSPPLDFTPNRKIPDDKIFEILLYLSVRDPISFHLIYPRHLRIPDDWIRFVTYATISPTRDGIGLTVKRAIIRYLATRQIHEITRPEVITLTKVAHPHPDQIRNLRPLFEVIQDCNE